MDEDNTTIDDLLEEERDSNNAPRISPLPEDNQTPAAPAANPPETDLPTDHPITDSDIDEHELYDEGLSGATENTKT